MREFALDALKSLMVLKEAGLKEVVLLHVIPREEVAYNIVRGYMKDEEEKIRETVRIRLEDWQKHLADEGIESQMHIIVGDVIPKVLAIAEEQKVDIIVAGHKTRTLLQSFYMGSHTMELLQRTSIPVLVYKYMV
jgi:nucleotide-binding universal stress UspA family protein